MRTTAQTIANIKPSVCIKHISAISSLFNLGKFRLKSGIKLLAYNAFALLLFAFTSMAYANNNPVWQHWSKDKIASFTNGYRSDVADFNQDNLPDFIVTSLYGNAVNVYLNDGNGKFATVVSPLGADGADLREVAAGELDGKPGLDFVVADFKNDAVYLYTNNGATPTPAFTRTTLPTDIASPNGAQSISLSDLDGINGLDIVLASQNYRDRIYVYLNDGAGNFTQSRIYDGDNYSLFEITVADVSGDDIPDIIAGDLGSTAGRNFWLKGNGDGTFQAGLNPYATEATDLPSLQTADFNGDSTNDIFAISKTELYWFENNGTGSFTEHLINPGEPIIDNGSQGNVADIDGDGDIDILMGSESDVIWYENNGLGSFTKQQISSGFELINAVNAVDFDGDNSPDIAVVDRVGGGVFWLKSQADFSVEEKNVVVGSVNAEDMDSDTLTYSISGGVDSAKFNINSSNGALTFQNAPDYDIPDDDGKDRIYNFNVSVSDAKANVIMPVEVTITEAPKFAPVITEGTSVSVTMSENANPTAFVLTLNATDQNNDTLTWSISSNATNGIASVSGTGTSKAIGYTPNINHDGTDRFNVRVSDGEGGMDTITVNVIIQNVNVLPMATSQTVSLAEDTAKAMTLKGTDSDGTIARYLIGTPSHGSLSGTAPNLTYIPTADFNGKDSFSFTVTDNDGGVSSAATVSISVSSVNDLPTASAQSVSVEEDGSVDMTLSGSDRDGTIARYLVGTPSHGSLSGTAPNLTYIPTADFNGKDSFAFTVTDNDGGVSSAVTVSITVSSINDLPMANAQSVSVEEDGSVGMTLSGSDRDGTIARYLVGTPSHGSLSGAAPNLTYTPTADFNGSDSFTFSVIDNEGGESEPVKVDITIDAVNDAPLAEDDTMEFDKNGQNRYVLDVLINDNDIDGDTLSVVSGNADIGSVVVENGQLVFNAPPGFIGSLTLTYLISDGNDGTTTATVTLTINGLFDDIAPTLTLPEDRVVNATALYTKVDLGVATALDANGNPLPVSLVDNRAMFSPGISKAYWQATDADGNQSISAQGVQIHPLISIGKDQTVVEGSTVTVKFYLNGTSPTYPVVVPFTVSGDALEGADHSLISGEVEISETNTASITFETYDDSVADSGETIVISLSDTVNISPDSVQNITLSEGNIAPEVMLTAKQQNENRTLLSRSDGEVTVSAAISDNNSADSHTLLWSSTSDELSVLINRTVSEAISFDAADLSVGIHKLTALVKDSGEPGLTTQAEIYLNVVSALPVLTETDTDGDLIPDSQEGFADSDGDGIADYLDAISVCNVVPEMISTQATFLVEGESGVCLRRGSAAPATQSGSLLLTHEETVQAVGEDGEAKIVGGIFDYIVVGLEKPGQEYKLVLPQRQPIPLNAIYRKYTDAAGWGNFVEDADNILFSTLGEPGFCPPPGSEQWQEGLTEGHWCVQLQIVDGGPNDNDGVANSSIADPGGVAIYLSTNTTPVAENDAITIQWNEAANIDVLANDSDIDGDELLVLSASANFGAVEVLANSSLSYMPKPDYAGIDTITYVISDGNGGTTSAQVNVNVIANRSPVANDDVASTDDRTVITIDILKNDTDEDGDTLKIISASAIHGSTAIVNNSIQYTPAIGFDGTDTVTYIISDNKEGEASAKVSVSVDAFESATVVNESKSSGSMSLFTLLLLPLAFVRRVKSIKLLAATILMSSLMVLPAKAEWGLTASVGQATAHVSKGELNRALGSLDAQITALDDSDTSWKLGVVYQVNKNWFMDVSYQSLGDFSASIDGMTLDGNAFKHAVSKVQPITAGGISAAVGYQYFINDQWYLGASSGVLVWKSDNKTYSQGLATINREENGTDLYFGIELGYQLSDNMSAGLGYTYYGLKQHDISSVGLTVKYFL